MDGIAWVASAMKAARDRLDIANQNLANGSTDGFRRATARGLMTASGVRIESDTRFEQGALRRTGRTFDLAIVGPGAFRVRDAAGHIALTRNGAFTRDRFGHLTDDAGRVLMGRRDPISVPEKAKVQSDGSIVVDGRCVERIPLPARASVRCGMLESSNVNAIGEMVDMLCAQRSFESAQKAFAAIDTVNDKASKQLAVLK
jgi:flagellar basal body rod protein FlgG